MFSSKLIRRLCPYGNTSIIDAVALNIQAEIQNNKYDILTTNLRLCHFLAQAATETDSFKTLREYASGSEYEGRTDLGNVQVGDGVRFRGRGIFQVTGRANYLDIGQRLGKGHTFVDNPALLEQPDLAVETALMYWKSHSLNQYADADDVLTITHRINGGENGLDDRRAYLTKAKVMIKFPLDWMLYADKDPDVKLAQEALVKVGYHVSVDSDFGNGTLMAVKDFQTKKGLRPTGIIDKATRDALGF